MAWHQSALRIYRTLLLAYPGEFRREYGPQMLHLFSQRLGQEPQWRLWLEVITDVAICAPREHFHLLANDVRHSTRMFSKSPGFTALALVVVALGIGASTTIYSLIHAILIRSLPYGDPQHLAYMWTPNPGLEGIPKEMAPPFADVIDWRRMSHSFSHITALQQKWLMVGNERVCGARVEANFFTTLQAVPQAGRTFDASDEFSAIISDALAQSLFASAIEALGKSIVLDKKQYTVVGVMPKDFGFPHSNDYPYATPGMKHTDIWIPLKLTSQQRADRNYSTDVVIGRLRPGVSIRQAQPEMLSIEKQLDLLYPEGMRG